MKRVILILPGLLFLTKIFGQKPKNTLLFLESGFTQTLTDRTKANNSFGLGIGLQLTLKANNKLSPAINLTDNFIFVDDKVYRTNDDGTEMKSIFNVAKLLAGANFNLTEVAYLSFLAGPCFINNETLLGVKPSIGFYLPRTKRCTANISYICILNRNSGQKENYSSLNFSVGIRLN